MEQKGFPARRGEARPGLGANPFPFPRSPSGMAPLSDTGTVPPPLMTEPDAMNPRTPMAGLRGIAAVGFAALVMACSSSEPPAGSGDGLAGRLVITGSSTVAPLAGELAKQFELLHPGVRIDVQSGGSSRGITDARRGTADIGMVSRAPKAGEQCH